MKPDKIKTYLDDMRCWYESHDRLNSRGANMNRGALAYIKKLEAVVEAAEDFMNSDGDYFAWTEDERHCMSRLRDAVLALKEDV